MTTDFDLEVEHQIYTIKQNGGIPAYIAIGQRTNVEILKQIPRFVDSVRFNILEPYASQVATFHGLPVVVLPQREEELIVIPAFKRY